MDPSQRTYPKRAARYEKYGLGGLASAIIFLAGFSFGISWQKGEVTPVCIVEPSFGGFVPSGGSSFVTWTKSQVLPVCYVTPESIGGGFVPAGRSSFGSSWNKDQVTPMCIVKPDFAGFVPSD